MIEINATPRPPASQAEARAMQPTAGIIDSQSIKTAESGGFCGYDAGKRIKGRKRHTFTATTGLLASIQVHSAGLQDRPSRQIAAQSPAGQRTARRMC